MKVDKFTRAGAGVNNIGADGTGVESTGVDTSGVDTSGIARTGADAAPVEELSRDQVLSVMSALDLPAIMHGQGAGAVVEFVNDEFAALLGYRSADEVVGLSAAQVVHRSSLANRDRDAARLAGGEVTTLRVQRTLIRRGGPPLYAWVSKRTLKIGDTALTLTMVTEYAESPAALSGAKEQWLAQHDELTGLANRRGFEAALLSGAIDFPATVFAVDIVGLKSLNDRYGHAVGDLVISTYARILGATAARANGVAARFGGDEFVVVIPHAATRTLLHHRDWLHTEIGIGGRRVSLQATVGRAEADTVTDVADARHLADIDMYRIRRVS